MTTTFKISLITISLLTNRYGSLFLQISSSYLQILNGAVVTPWRTRGYGRENRPRLDFEKNAVS